MKRSLSCFAVALLIGLGACTTNDTVKVADARAGNGGAGDPLIPRPQPSASGTVPVTGSAEADDYSKVDAPAIRQLETQLNLAAEVGQIEQVHRRVWGAARPKEPDASPDVAIDLVVSGGLSTSETSLLMWRAADGSWLWMRGDRTPDKPFSNKGGFFSSALGKDVDARIASLPRAKENWYAPAIVPLNDGRRAQCGDGPAYRMRIRRSGRPDELVVQMCGPRWVNGQLISVLLDKSR